MTEQHISYQHVNTKLFSEVTNTEFILLCRHVEDLEGGSGTEATESLREEFTQRLVTMERKFQQALREKENTKKLLEVCLCTSNFMKGIFNICTPFLSVKKRIFCKVKLRYE